MRVTTFPSNSSLSKGDNTIKKHGNIIAGVMSFIYLLCAFFIGKNILESKAEADFGMYFIEILLILLPIIILLIYVIRNKSTQEKKYKTNEIVAWLSLSPIILILFALYIVLSVPTSKTTLLSRF